MMQTRPKASGFTNIPTVASAGPHLSSTTITAEAEAPLLLQAANGRVIYSFSAATISAIRYMLAKSMITAAFPSQLAIVSALREEGVTHTALAIAATIANDTAKRVCYVDLNWWWPSPRLAPIFAQAPGIEAVLHREVAVETMLIATNHASLKLLPAGNLHPAQRPIMARSPALTGLIKQLGERFDYLLLDIPAILTSSDAIALASLGAACCTVVRHGVSTSALTGRALKEIEHLPMLGVIMNRVRPHTPAWLLKWIPQE